MNAVCAERHKKKSDTFDYIRCLIGMKKTIFILAMVFSAAFTLAAQQNEAKIERYLLVVGANNGGADRIKLRYAESDANAFATVLSQMGGIPQANIFRVNNPTAASLAEGFRNLDSRLRGNDKRELGNDKNKIEHGNGKSKMEHGSDRTELGNSKGNVRKEVLVYYSGHADEQGLRINGDVFSWSDFRNSVNKIDADVKVAVLDACGSGAITRTKGGVSKPAFLQDASSEMKGYAFLTSSNENEASQESDRIKGSFFTHALVSGLRGAADMTGDGKVTLNEAYQFAFNETLQSTQSTSGGTQHPSRDMNLAGTGDVVMTDLREIGAGLVLNEQLEGRFFVRDDKGNLVAELYKREGKSLELGLPPGTYSVQMEAPSRNWKAGDITLANGKKQVLSMNDLKTIDKETAIARGNADSSLSAIDSAKKATFSPEFNFYSSADKPTNGIRLGFFFTDVKRPFIGTQISLLGNLSREYMSGAQGSMVANVSIDELYGTQISPVLNVANKIYGVQAGVTNVTYGKFKGAQAGIINASADGYGVQAGVINMLSDSLLGVQGGVINLGNTISGHGGGINAAGSVDYVQGGVINAAGSVGYVQGGVINAAGSVGYVQGGVINVAGSVGKLQAGVINIGGSVDRQIGVINISGHSERTPIGLINIVGNGIYNGTIYTNEMGNAAILVQLGTPYLYTLLDYQMAMKKSYEPQIWLLGFGTNFGRRGTHFSLDYAWGNVVHSKTAFEAKDDNNQLNRLRFGGTYRIFEYLGISSGVSANVLQRHGAEGFDLSPRGDYHWHWTFGDYKVRVFPGIYAGLTVGKF
ncbi:hypothetical protein AGMMS49938_13770 [Fibrobacterales bacterium]|nr:hypothetical protein AGMMS49938_13770 [Fibrobacterales bacterium]